MPACEYVLGLAELQPDTAAAAHAAADTAQQRAAHRRLRPGLPGIAPPPARATLRMPRSVPAALTRKRQGVCDLARVSSVSNSRSSIAAGNGSASPVLTSVTSARL